MPGQVRVPGWHSWLPRSERRRRLGTEAEAEELEKVLEAEVDAEEEAEARKGGRGGGARARKFVGGLPIGCV